MQNCKHFNGRIVYNIPAAAPAFELAKRGKITSSEGIRIAAAEIVGNYATQERRSRCHRRRNACGLVAQRRRLLLAGRARGSQESWDAAQRRRRTMFMCQRCFVFLAIQRPNYAICASFFQFIH